MKIYIGFDVSKPECFDVCKFSIQKRTNEISINKIGNSILSNDIWYRKRNDLETTDFSICRFLVPYLSNYDGISVFMDDDFLWQCDVKELMNYYDDTKSVMVCKHDYVPKHTKKWSNNKQTKYNRKKWSSLMMFNNMHQDCKKLDVKAVNEQEGLWLHQFEWTDSVGIIPLSYNFLVDEYEPYENIKALHFTNGCPIFDECKTQELADKWINEKRNFENCR